MAKIKLVKFDGKKFMKVAKDVGRSITGRFKKLERRLDKVEHKLALGKNKMK